MFFQEHEKRIYSPPSSETKYDPIRVDRILTVVTKGRFNEFIAYRNAPHDNKGDVSAEGKIKALEMSARAEIELADAARAAFDLPKFPDCTDAQALEILYDFLGWMEGKGERARTPQDSPTISQGQTSLSVATVIGYPSYSISKESESNQSSILSKPSGSVQEPQESHPNG